VGETSYTKVFSDLVFRLPVVWAVKKSVEKREKEQKLRWSISFENESPVLE